MSKIKTEDKTWRTIKLSCGGFELDYNSSRRTATLSRDGGAPLRGRIYGINPEAVNFAIDDIDIIIDMLSKLEDTLKD